MTLTTGEDSSNTHAIAWANDTVDEIEALRVRISEAEKGRQEKAGILEKTEVRLAKIRGNRKKPARGNGKSEVQPYQHPKSILTASHSGLEDEVQEVVTRLQGELRDNLLAIEAMGSELQLLEKGLEPLQVSARPLQTPEVNPPNYTMTGENPVEVHEREEGFNQEEIVHSQSSAPTVDRKQAGAAETVDSTSVEPNNLLTSENVDCSRESHFENMYIYILTYHIRSHTPVKSHD